MESFVFNRQKRKIFGLRISAVVETFVFLIVVTLLNYLFGDGTRFVNYMLHPYWIIVLLVTVQYGTAEGVFAAVLSSIFLYADNIPPQKADEPFFDYQLRLSTLPALWFITAFILGELRMRLEWENDRLHNDYVHAKSEVEKITAEYQVLKESNQNLEVQLTSQEETVAVSFGVFKALAALEPAQIIFGLNSIINVALHPNKFSVFAKGPNGLEAVTSEGWAAQDKYCRRFVPTSALYKTIVDGKKLISIVNKDEQKILEHEGILAAPLVDPDSGEVFGMIKIEDINFRTLNLSRLETFRTVSELIGRAYANAKKHRTSKQTSIYAIPDILYSNAFFKIAASYLEKFSETAGFPLMVLRILLLKGKHIEEDWIKALQKILPETIRCFEGTTKAKEILLLCPLTQVDQGERLKEQIEQWFALEGKLQPGEFQIQKEMLTSRLSLKGKE